jgi:hypothetical protein
MNAAIETNYLTKRYGLVTAVASGPRGIARISFKPHDRRLGQAPYSLSPSYLRAILD